MIYKGDKNKNGTPDFRSLETYRAHQRAGNFAVRSDVAD
jgi:hypothetical protein